MKVAFVHDWLNGMRGGEKCLEALLEVFPDATVYTLLCEKDKISKTIASHEICSTWIEKLPFWRSKYRYYLPLFPSAIRSFKIEGYDLIVSISHCAAKGIEVSDGTKHVCYCLTPMRYVWEFKDVYFSSGRFKLLRLFGMNVLLDYLRKWDLKTAKNVDEFISISQFVRQRIDKFYRRDSHVIYPPVDTDMFYYHESEKKEDYDLVVSALVPYKRIDLVIDVYNENGRKLKIVGAGTEYERIKNKSHQNIEFLGWIQDDRMREIYAKARVLIFPGIEDFGIVPLEAQACGTPVIAFNSGGTLETVIDGKTGLFFQHQQVDSLKEVVEKIDGFVYDRAILRNNALRFSRDQFKEKMFDSLISSLGGKKDR
ncbi:MAG: glycosyltransferase [Chlamydiota bacterium]|nr:glycosyltransferase [Chlamydiota bacterium]